MPPLVKQHLENASADLLEEYKKIIGLYLRGKPGVYVLYYDSKVYYIGLATNLSRRLKRHLDDKHQKRWNRFSIYLTRDGRHLREIEALLHRIARPSGNRQIGKLTGSGNLRAELKRELRAHHRQREERLLGTGSRPRRSVKNKGRRAARPLAGLVDRAVPLWGSKNGREYKARLLKNGLIRFNGNDYTTPTAAGRAASRRSVNGWTFWWFRNHTGEWQQLDTLRR